MSDHPINLALRFLLELATWAAMGYWGFSQHQGLLGWALGLGLPLLAMAVWGTFRVHGDPGTAPVNVPGWLRLLIEFIEFGGAAALLINAGARTLGYLLAAIIIVHYAISYDRVGWLLRQTPG